MCICYSTDSDEHLINIGEKAEPHWDYFTQQEIQEDIDAWNDYLDDELNNYNPED